MLLERSPNVDYFEPTKSFVYCLFPHGKDALRNVGLADIDQAGVVMLSFSSCAHQSQFMARHVCLSPRDNKEPARNSVLLSTSTDPQLEAQRALFATKRAITYDMQAAVLYRLYQECNGVHAHLR